jgi:hypothetical protein
MAAFSSTLVEIRYCYLFISASFTGRIFRIDIRAADAVLKNHFDFGAPPWTKLAFDLSHYHLRSLRRCLSHISLSLSRPIVPLMLICYTYFYTLRISSHSSNSFRDMGLVGCVDKQFSVLYSFGCFLKLLE